MVVFQSLPGVTINAELLTLPVLEMVEAVAVLAVRVVEVPEHGSKLLAHLKNLNPASKTLKDLENLSEMHLLMR